MKELWAIYCKDGDLHYDFEDGAEVREEHVTCSMLDDANSEFYSPACGPHTIVHLTECCVAAIG